MGHDSHAKSHDQKHGDHGHGQGHGHDHAHHHHEQPLENSVIRYDIPDAPHHVEDFKAPDWRLFKVEAPELVAIQDRLAAKGLKDPWLRNEAWRYDRKFGATPKRELMLRSASIGMKWGFILAVGTILLQTGYRRVFGGGDHGHGHGHGKANASHSGHH